MIAHGSRTIALGFFHSVSDTDTVVQRAALQHDATPCGSGEEGQRTPNQAESPSQYLLAGPNSSLPRCGARCSGYDARDAARGSVGLNAVLY